MITPVCAETPNSSASRSPSSVIMTLTMMSEARFIDLNLLNRMTKMIRTVSGTIMAKRAAARFPPPCFQGRGPATLYLPEGESKQRQRAPSRRLSSSGSYLHP